MPSRLTAGVRTTIAFLLFVVAVAISILAIRQIVEGGALRTRAAPARVEVLSSAVEGGDPKVRFRLTVDEREIESTRVAALAWRGDEAAARELVERCPAGGGCLGFYDPKDPTKAFLELRGVPIRWHALLLACVALSAVGLVTLSSASTDIKPAVAWIIGGIAVLLHYVAVSEQYDLFLATGAASVVVGGGALLTRTVR